MFRVSLIQFPLLPAYLNPQTPGYAKTLSQPEVNWKPIIATDFTDFTDGNENIAFSDLNHWETANLAQPPIRFPNLCPL
jgi:hypothetical protein